jgi:hypothetical protein
MTILSSRWSVAIPLVWLQLYSPCEAFLPTTRIGTSLPFLSAHSTFSSSRLWSSSVVANTVATSNEIMTVKDLATRIESCVQAGDNPATWIDQLETSTSNTTITDQPNRAPGFLGTWHVWYTDCPPPSNGKLGPFQGTAGQAIEGSDTRAYKNLLSVPPNDWLTAVLEGVWEDWDGALLSSSSTNDAAAQGETEATINGETLPKNSDWGANHWKVTFLNLRISIFGFPLFTKEFPASTARVWRTTYLDDDIRVVRAGKTGRVEDEVVFYTKRSPPPEGWVPS